MQRSWAYWAAFGLGAGALLAQACVLPGYETTAGSGAGATGGGGAGAAGGHGGEGGHGGTPTTSSGGGGGAGGGEPCEAPPGYEVIACDQGAPGEIAVLNNEVYWATAAGAIMKTSAGGGAAPQEIAEAEAPICWMAAQGDRLAWRTTAGHVRLRLQGGQIVPIAQESPEDPCTVALDEAYVYWFGQTNPGKWEIRRADASGALASVVAMTAIVNMNMTRKPLGLDVSRGVATPHVFWTEPDEGKAFWYDLSGGQPTEFYMANGPFGHLASDGLAYYVANQNSNSIRRGQAGQGEDAPVAVGQDQPGRLLVDADFVFWLNVPEGDGHAEVRRAGKEQMSAPGEVVTPGLSQVCGFAVDQGHLYVTTCADGRVLRRLL